jgi:hypothetical protein
MAAILQLRRGTTASKPTLSAGEMYVNTTSQSLQVGIDGSNEITLAKLNSVNSGSFNVSGDITLGGTITIGDTTSDNIVFNADLSSSLIPNNDNSFDLGSTSSKYRNVYATSISGAIASTNGVVSGSSQVIGILSSLNSFSASNGNTSLNSYTSSQDTKNSTLATYTGSIDGKFTTLQTLTASYSSSIGLINSFTSSQDTKNTTLATTSGSLITSQSNATIAVSNLNTFTSSVNGHITDINSKTGSYAKTNVSNIFSTDQTITGSLYISANLIVQGSSSINVISQSTLSIGTNLITVNAQNPSSRFAGLAVIDSGSSPARSGSWLFDSINDNWIMIHQNAATITSSVALLGAETYNNIGGETYPTLNRLVKGLGYEHIGDSNISDTGTEISLNSLTSVTGSFVVSGGITGSIRSTNGVVSGSSQILGGSGIWSGSAQLPSGIISGSSQLTSSFAVTGSNTFTGNQIITGSLIITGSAKGNVVPITIASSTASLDMNVGSYFTLTLANTATTHIRATNITPGTTATLLITTGTNSSASLSPTLLQPSGSFYTASLGSGKKDVLSLVSFDTTNMYVVSTKAMQ